MHCFDIKLVDGEGKFYALRSSDREVIGLDLDLYEENLHFDISVGRGMVGLGEIVGVAREICDRIAEFVVQKNIEQGERIPCCRGCSDCCNYLITASSAETFSLVDEVKQLDHSFYKYVQRNALLASKKILKKKLPENFDHNQLDNLSGWYKSLNLNCPFLFEGSCSIYNIRPISCREYFIKGSPNACKGKRGSAEVLEMPVSIASVLNEFCSALEGESDTSIMLPLFQVWANDNCDRSLRKWPAVDLVRAFVEILQKQNREAFSMACNG